MFFNSVSEPQQRTPERLADITAHLSVLAERRQIKAGLKLLMEAELKINLLLVLFVRHASIEEGGL